MARSTHVSLQNDAYRIPLLDEEFDHELFIDEQDYLLETTHHIFIGETND